ncbi:MAG: FliG C-terminal domain-containing protein [Pseudomonadota bacterium]
MIADGAADMTPVQKAAVLLMLLEEDQSAAFIADLDPVQAETLGAAMLEIADVDRGTTDAVIASFLDHAGAAAPVRASETGTRSLFAKALGEARAAHILAAAPSSSKQIAPELQWIARARLAELLAQEHPQLIAAALSLMPPAVAADVVPQLDADVQADCLMRLARLEELGDGAVALIREAYGPDLLPIAFAAPVNRVEGVAAAVDILKGLSPADAKAIQARISERDDTLAQRIDEQMVVFEDLMTIDARAMQQVIAAVQPDVLAMALRGAPATLKAHILAGMSTRAAQTLEDTMKEARPAAQDDVDRARTNIMRAVRDLADKGEIVLGGGDDLV